MRVVALGLRDFRNFERAELQLGPELNLIVGHNAQGKTNLLEAVYCLGGLGSPRSADPVLVRDGSERAVLHARIARAHREVRIDMELRPRRGTRVLINGAAAPPGALPDACTSVFFGPDELSLIKGAPDGRRRFVDDVVVKLRPARQDLRRQWERVLRQRNALLKSAPRGTSFDDTLDVWDESFARVGAALAAARLEVLGRLLPYVRKRYEEIAGGNLDLEYESGWMAKGPAPAAPDEPELRAQLTNAVREVRTRELERGVSLVGPQRDDVCIRLRSDHAGATGLLDARAYASQGDQRTAALALKLAESDLLFDALAERPILLLDDVFSELDPRRREWLSDAVRNRGQQVLLSSAEPGGIAVSPADVVVEVRAGRIVTGG